MRIRCFVLPALLVVAAAGCSDSSGSTAADTAATAEPRGDDGQDAAVLVSSCTADYTTLAVAIETHIANGGTVPVTEQELVDEQLLFEPFDTFDVSTDGLATVVVAAPGGPCDGVDLALADDGDTAPADPTSAESDCAVQRTVLETALEAFVANGGTLPVDEAGLITAGFLRVEFEDYDIEGELVVPVGDRCAGS